MRLNTWFILRLWEHFGAPAWSSQLYCIGLTAWCRRPVGKIKNSSNATKNKSSKCNQKINQTPNKHEPKMDHASIQNRPKLDQKSIQNQEKSVSLPRLFLDRFGSPFGSHLGSSWRPNWGHVGFCLLVSFSINFWADFWWLLGAHVGAMLEAKTVRNRKKGDLESFLSGV